MPIIVYTCPKGHRVQNIQRFDAPAPKTCDQCKSRKLERVDIPGGSSFQLKGRGWAKDGYADPNQSIKKKDHWVV